MAFTRNRAGGSDQGVTASGEVVWTDADLGDSGEIQITESIAMGSAEPKVWCVSFPEEAADALDHEYFQVEVVNDMVTASPEQHEPLRFSCLFFNNGEDAGGIGAIDDVVIANPTKSPETVIDDLQANPTEPS